MTLDQIEYLLANTYIVEREGPEAVRLIKPYNVFPIMKLLDKLSVL